MGYFALFLCSLGGRVKVFGRHHVPEKGPYVIVINHFSYVDPPFVIHAIQKPISFLAASDQVIEPLYIWAPFIYGFIPTDRTRLAPSTIKKSIRSISNGEIIGIFPEGTSLSRVLRPAKNGAAFLSTTGNVKILPVGIVGLEDALEGFFKGIRPSVHIRIGKPFGPYSVSKSKREREQDLLKIGHKIMCRIAALLPDDRHGVFSGESMINHFRRQNRLPDF